MDRIDPNPNPVSNSRLKLMTQERIFSNLINQTKKRKEQSMDGVSRYDAIVPHAKRHSRRIESRAQAAGNAQVLLVGNMQNLFGVPLK